jgi:HSP20 family protein
MLTRWDPFREMFRLQNRMNRLFDRTFQGALEEEGDVWPTAEWTLPLDVIENEDEYVIKASIPGIDLDDLDIIYAGNTLTIKGETQAEREDEGVNYHLRERRFGRFMRSITLPNEVDSDHIEASYSNGVLSLHAPKVEQAKPKRIQVQSGEKQKFLKG